MLDDVAFDVAGEDEGQAAVDREADAESPAAGSTSGSIECASRACALVASSRLLRSQAPRNS
ncbi:hypothetical protein [Streptomyces sp. NPDC005141]